MIMIPFHGSNALLSHISFSGSFNAFHIILALLCIIIALVKLQDRNGFKLAKNNTAWLLYIISFIVALAIGYHQYKKNALSDVSSYLITIMLYILSTSKYVETKTIRQLLNFTFYALMINSCLNILMYYTQDFSFWGVESFNVGRFGGNYYTLLIITLPYALYDYLHDKQIKSIWILIAFGAGTWGSILLQSRTHVLLTLFCCVVVLFDSLKYRTSKNKYLFRIMILTSGIAMGFILFRTLSASNNSFILRVAGTELGSENDTLLTRIQTVSYYLKNMINHPLDFGFGKKIFYIYQGVIASNTGGFYIDNAVMTVETRGGVIFALTYIYLLLEPIFELRTFNKRRRNQLFLPLIISYCCFLFAAAIMTSQTTHGMAIYTFLWVFIGTLKKQQRAMKKRPVSSISDKSQP